jgi:DNA-directed RNA polymerase subunit RPC12/RpoP
MQTLPGTNLAILDAYHQNEVNNSLSTKFPEIAHEWDYDKNGPLTPEMFSYGSMSKVWWKCAKGHEWYDSINNRTSKGFGCPYCSGKRAIPGKTDLATRYPDLMREWDFEKNVKVDPHTILPKTSRKVWWKCAKGHEWQASVISRTNMHSGCPYCSGRFAIAGVNDLATTNPDLLREWSYERNKDIQPTEIKAGSEQKVWWHCDKCGHDYQATPSNRIYGHTGCPYCANQVPGYTRQNREGQEVISNSGQKMKVLHYRKATDIDVQFEDGTIVEHRSYYSFLKGRIRNPNFSAKIKSQPEKEKGTAISSNVLLFFRYIKLSSGDLQCGQSVRLPRRPARRTHGCYGSWSAPYPGGPSRGGSRGSL